MNIDISVIVPAHHEGRLAHPTMMSVFRSAAYASEKGIKTEILVIMDAPDEKTRAYFSRYENTEILFETVAFRDLGLTRNFGVKQASGRYVTLLDADNLFGKNWIADSFADLESHPGDMIVHPEYHLVFEAENRVWKQLSSDDPRCDIGNLMENNYWDANCTAKRELLLKYPYEATTATPGFGFEDWHFNCKTLADGIPHRIVPGTVNFLRKKRTGSLLAQSLQTHRIVRPNSLFDPDIFAAMMERSRETFTENSSTND